MLRAHRKAPVCVIRRPLNPTILVGSIPDAISVGPFARPPWPRPRARPSRPGRLPAGCGPRAASARLDRREAAGELGVGRAQRRFGVDVQVPREVGHRRTAGRPTPPPPASGVAASRAPRPARAASSAILSSTCAGRRPVEAHPRGALLQLDRPHQRRQAQRHAVEHAALALGRALGGLARLPVAGLLLGASCRGFRRRRHAGGGRPSCRRSRAPRRRSRSARPPRPSARGRPPAAAGRPARPAARPSRARSIASATS